MKKRNIIFILLLSGLFLLSTFMIVKHLSTQQKEENEFLKITEIAECTEALPIEVNTESVTEESRTVQTVHIRNLNVLSEINSDCVGWICIEGTNIDYPVMHTPNNPQKYLRKDFNGEYSSSGVPFMDSRCSIDGGTVILYGHNMKNGTMFSSLKKYLSADFRSTHKNIMFQTVNGVRVYTVTDVKKTDIHDEVYNQLNDDDTLVLSTCYGSDKNGRIIIIAKERKNNG